MDFNHKMQFSDNALKLKKSCQKKFLKIFHVGNCFTPIGNCFTPIGNFFTVPGLAVKTNVFLYKNYTDDSPSSKLRRGSHASS